MHVRVHACEGAAWEGGVMHGVSADSHSQWSSSHR